MKRNTDPAKDFEDVLQKVKQGSATDRTGLASLAIAFIAASATVGSIIGILA